MLFAKPPGRGGQKGFCDHQKNGNPHSALHFCEAQLIGFRFSLRVGVCCVALGCVVSCRGVFLYLGCIVFGIKTMLFVIPLTGGRAEDR